MGEAAFYPLRPALAPDALACAAVAAALSWSMGVTGMVLAASVVPLSLLAAWPDRDSYRPSQANRVTLVRAAAVGGVAAWLFEGDPPLPVVGLAAVALALDGVDGFVARRTRTTTAFGARLDGELDALFMAVLSVLAAYRVGPWVLLAGALRYLWVLAQLGLPWLRQPLDDRYARKVLCALGAAALITSLALPTGAAVAAAFGVACLASSFGRDALYLRRASRNPG